MCGIFGVHGHPDAVRLTQLGLYSLQHRGQESAGVVSINEKGDARAVRSMGTMSTAMSEELERVVGIMAIGHTRYSTAGSSSIENAQPVLARTKGGFVALAHNGNLTNAAELRMELEDRGSIFSSTMDSEVIVHRLARSNADSPDDRLAEALCEVEGAFSLIVTIGDTLLAARDPRGWRPLVFGRLGNAPVFASETCALDIVGATYELALIRNHYIGRTFIQPTQAGRDAKVKVKYNPVREVLEGKKVVMVDDSIVRGTTTRGLVALVRGAGAREVHMRVSSPPVTGPCYYGIDTPSREELIAARLSPEEIARDLGVDSLGYLSLEGMLESVHGGPHGFCHACFSGDYPTAPPTDPDKLRFGCGC